MFDGKVATSKAIISSVVVVTQRIGTAEFRGAGSCGSEARALEKLRQRSATSIQASARRWRTRLYIHKIESRI